MTRVCFYTKVAQPFDLIVNLSQKALVQHHQVTVYVSDAIQAAALSDVLWQQQGASFVAHALATDINAQYSPVHVVWQPEQVTQDDILVNCQAQQALFFGRFKQMYEIVSTIQADVIAGRRRYTFYRERGYPITHIDHETVAH